MNQLSNLTLCRSNDDSGFTCITHITFFSRFNLQIVMVKTIDRRLLMDQFVTAMTSRLDKTIIIGGCKGAPGPPPGSIFFFIFMQFRQKIRLAHQLWELAPPLENPGSATDNCCKDIILIFDISAEFCWVRLSGKFGRLIDWLYSRVILDPSVDMA